MSLTCWENRLHGSSISLQFRCSSLMVVSSRASGTTICAVHGASWSTRWDTCLCWMPITTGSLFSTRTASSCKSWSCRCRSSTRCHWIICPKSASCWSPNAATPAITTAWCSSGCTMTKKWSTGHWRTRIAKPVWCTESNVRHVISFHLSFLLHFLWETTILLLLNDSRMAALPKTMGGLKRGRHFTFFVKNHERVKVKLLHWISPNISKPFEDSGRHFQYFWKVILAVTFRFVGKKIQRTSFCISGNANGICVVEFATEICVAHIQMWPVIDLFLHL